MIEVERILPNPDVRKLVIDLLDEEALALGHRFVVDNTVFVVREGGAVLGGLCARLSLDIVYVELLAVRPSARGRGIGRALLTAAEDWGRAQGAAAIYLDTYGFQAPKYYPRLGYVPMGTIAGHTPERNRYFFQKPLTGE